MTRNLYFEYRHLWRRCLLLQRSKLRGASVCDTLRERRETACR